MAETTNSELSEREREVLRLVATGAGNKEIAQKLFISPNTVKVHLRNIFAKVGAASRTEATLYAIQQGIVKIDEVRPSPATEAEIAPVGVELLPEVAAPPESASPPIGMPLSPTGAQSQWGLRQSYPLILLVSLLAVSITITIVAVWRSAPTPTPTALPPTPIIAKWQDRAPLPTARSGLAVATYENQIYAIGGATETGATNAVEAYDPNTNAWVTRAPKPVAVADVGAAVIGGQIYVPGGRLTSGALTNLLEVYNPRLNIWATRAALPIAVSGYALVAYEGQLYLFGGWDGTRYLNSVYAYDPTNDVWNKKSPLPTARGFAGAAVASGRIYVMGGTNGEEVLAVNEVYTPETEGSTTPAWQIRSPLPQGRAEFGMTSVAEIIHIIGGLETPQSSPTALKYFSQRDEWESFPGPISDLWRQPGLVALGTRIYALGGRGLNAFLNHHTSFQAIYTITIPVIP